MHAWQKVGLKSFFGSLIILASSQAQAIEFGVIRPLQHGPIGDSPQFTSPDQYEGEGAIVTSRSWGKYTVNDDPDSKISGSSIKSRVAAGGGWAPSKQFLLSGYLDFTLASDVDEEQKRTSPSSHLDGGLYRHELAVFGTFKSSPLVLGGGLGVLVVGSESREFDYDNDKDKEEITSAAMPVLRLYGGLMTKEVEATLGLRLFSKGDATVEAHHANGDKDEFDIVRRNPAEIHADGKLKLGEVQLAASLSYLLMSQASEQIDEFSMEYNKTGTTKTRATGSGRRSDNQLKVGAGARFDPTKMVGILGGLSYIGSSYAKPEYATLEHENIGGLRLDVGADVKFEAFKGFLQAGYLMDNSVSYTVDGNSRAAANVERTQRTPLNDGDHVKVSQGSWTLGLGGGVQF